MVALNFNRVRLMAQLALDSLFALTLRLQEKWFQQSVHIVTLLVFEVCCKNYVFSQVLIQASLLSRWWSLMFFSFIIVFIRI